MLDGPILVTGAGGQLGSRLEAALRERGAVVTGAGHNHERSVELRLLDQVQELVREVRPRTVIHVGGTSTLAELLRDPQGGNQNVVQPAVNVMEALASEAPGARLVLVSPAEVYGRAGRLPTDETSPLVPVDLYAAARAAVEYMSRAYVARGVQTVVARVFPFVGRGLDRRSFFGDLAWHAARGLPMQVGNPELRRDVHDLRDTVDGLLTVAAHGQSGQAYNLCSGRAISLRQAAEAVRVRLEADPARALASDLPILLGSPARAEALGWRRRHALEESLAELVTAG